MSPDRRFEIRRFLGLQPWFASLPPEDRASIECRILTVQGSRGAVTVPAERTGAGWFAVLSGFVKLQTPGGAREPAFVALCGGDWFGEGSAMTGEAGRYEVVALRDSVLLCLPRSEFLRLLDKSVAFNQAVLHHMDRRVKQTLEIIRCDRGRSMERRLALYLGPLFWHGLRPLDLSQRELGSLCGMSRQAVNCALQKLAARGLVRTENGRVMATDPDALRAFCHGEAPVDAAGVAPARESGLGTGGRRLVAGSGGMPLPA